MRFCKYCGSQISDDASFCTNCGKNVAQAQLQPQQTVSKKAEIVDKAKELAKKPVVYIVAAVLVVVIILISVLGNRCDISGCKNKPIDGSKYCYSHACSVTGCGAAQTGYSNYCYSHYLIYDDEATEGIGGVSSSDLDISDVYVHSEYSYTYAEGTLTNNGSKTVTFVKLKGAFETSYGTVVDTDWTYAVGTEGLAPGESCKWKMSVDKDYSIDSCHVTILDFDD